MAENLSDYEKARRAAYEPLMERLSKGDRRQAWIFQVSCGLGWEKEILKLVDRLDAIWEGHDGKKGSKVWDILQVKEKFGGLRFYAGFPKGEGVEEKVNCSREAIGKTETACLALCEKCGKKGKESRPNGLWVKTLCKKCDKEIRGMKDMRVSCTGLG